MCICGGLDETTPRWLRLNVKKLNRGAEFCAESLHNEDFRHILLDANELHLKPSNGSEIGRFFCECKSSQ